MNDRDRKAGIILAVASNWNHVDKLAMNLSFGISLE